MTDFEESGVFNDTLSKWIGDNFNVNDGNFDPHPLDLHTASSIGETQLVRKILEKRGIEINAVNRGGWSALMYASYMGHSDTIVFLLENGADPNQRTPLGSTPLILAAMCGYDAVMTDILKNGGDLEARDEKGWTALLHAVSSGHQQTTEYLLKVGANFEIVEPSHGLTPVMEAAASGHESIVLQLVKHGADVSRTGVNGDDALALAWLYGHIEVAQVIEDSKYKSKISSPQKSSRVPGGRPPVEPTHSYGSSGPSIHAGPRAFAEMTGLGSDGKPKPSAATPRYLEEPVPQSQVPNHFESKWNGPEDLASLLQEIDCSKYLPILKEQDIDLRIFLSLTEADLKEIGIKLFGPRRKMVATIGRVNNSIRGSLVDKVELSFCDSLLRKLRTLEEKLKKANEKNLVLSSQLAQERQLRSVAEGVLIEQKEFKSAIHGCMDKLRKEHHNLLLAVEVGRMQHMKASPSNIRQPANRHCVLPAIHDGVEEMHSALKHSDDCLLEMRRLMQTFGSTSISSGHGSN